MPQRSSANSVPRSHPSRKPVARAATPTAVQHPSGTLTVQIQSFCAQAALLFLPMPALKHPSMSLTVADLFLVPAVLLNLGYGLRLQWFQMLLLLALPFNLLSHMLDPSGELISILQMVYIWGLLVPFGWCAFVTLPKERVALILLVASGLSCVVAMGQFMGVVPTLPTQKLIEFGGTGGRRAAGLVLQCNSLAMALTPCFLLLPQIPRAGWRIAFLLLLIGGIASTVSKAIIFAVPGFLFYFVWREPEKLKVLRWLVVVLVIGLLVLSQGIHLGDVFTTLWETIQYRMDYADNSVDDRTHLARLALGYADDCWLLGYGTQGTYERMGQDNMAQTVHVFYLGLWLTVGGVAVAITLVSFGGLLVSLWRLRQINEAIYLFTHLLAISATTMLYLSYQYAPFLIAAAALARTQRQTEWQARSQPAAASSVRPRVARRAA